MTMSIDADSVAIAAFTGELLEYKLQEIDQLEADQGPVSRLASLVVREAATTAHAEQLDRLCTDLGELALSIPVNRMAMEAAELKSQAGTSVFEQRVAARSVTNYGAKLSFLLPFLTDDITAHTAKVVASIETQAERELDPEAAARLKSLTAVETVLGTPITSSAVTNRLLAYFALHGSDDQQERMTYLPQHPRPLSANQLVRQMTATTPDERFLEYCTAFRAYPIEVTALADLVYRHDARDIRQGRSSMVKAANPKQLNGQAAYRKLAEHQLILQRGWRSESVAGSDTVKKKLVVRSFRASDYSPARHVGEASDGSDLYTWEPVEADLVQQAESYSSND